MTECGCVHCSVLTYLSMEFQKKSPYPALEEKPPKWKQGMKKNFAIGTIN